MKNVYKYILLVYVILCVIRGNAQQVSLFNTYSLDPLQLNIAFAGSTCNEATIHYRTQWINLMNAPKGLQLNAHKAIGKSNAVVLRVNTQSQGLLNFTGVTLGYGYRFKINETAKIHLGIGVGWNQALLKAKDAIVIDEHDVNLNNGNNLTANGFDSEFGLMVIGQKLKIGFSVLHLYNSNPDFSGSGRYKALPQINPQVSYVFNKNKKVEIEPWLVNRYTLKGDNVVEGILNFNFLKVLTLGAGYRTNYGFITLVGYKVGNLKIAYSFDYGTSKNSVNIGSSHQIMLGISGCKTSSFFKKKTDFRHVSNSDNEAPDEDSLDENNSKIVRNNKPLKSKKEVVVFSGNISSQQNPEKPIANKEVVVKNERGEIIETTRTNDIGEFTFRNLPQEQNYTISVLEEGSAIKANVSLAGKNGEQVKLIDADSPGAYEIKPEVINKVAVKTIAEPKDALAVETKKEEKVQSALVGQLTSATNSKLPLANTEVLIKNEKGEVVGTAKTNSLGEFKVNNLPSNQKYTISVLEKGQPVAASVSLTNANGGESVKLVSDSTGVVGIKPEVFNKVAVKTIAEPKDALAVEANKEEKVQSALVGQLTSASNSKLPLANTEVLIKNEKGEVVGTAKTNSLGEFKVNNLPSNQKYTISVLEKGQPVAASVNLTNANGGESVKLVSDSTGVVGIKPEVFNKVAVKTIAEPKDALAVETKKEEKVQSALVGQLTSATNSKLPLANTEVLIKNEKGEVVGTAKTNSLGEFKVNNLPSNQKYTISVLEKGQPVAASVNLTNANGGESVKLTSNTKGTFEIKPEVLAKVTLHKDKTENSQVKSNPVLAPKTNVKANAKETLVRNQSARSNPKSTNSVVVKSTKPKENIVSKKDSVQVVANESVVTSIESRQIIVNKLNTISEEVIFSINMSQLDAKGLKKLNEIAALIKSDPSIKIDITGYTCMKGTKEFNSILAIRRAVYVRQELIKRGVKANSFNRSFGTKDNEQLYDNSTPELQVKNRTVRFTLVSTDSGKN